MPSLICCPISFILTFVQSFIWEVWDFQDHQNSGRWAEFPWRRPSFSVCGTFLKSLVWYFKNNLKECQMNNALYKQVYKRRLYTLHGALYNAKNGLWFFLQLPNKLKYFIHLYQNSKQTPWFIFIDLEMWKKNCTGGFFCLIGSYRSSDILVNIIIFSTYIMFICKALCKCLLFNPHPLWSR